MGVPSLNDLAVEETLNTTNQPTNQDNIPVWCSMITLSINTCNSIIFINKVYYTKLQMNSMSCCYLMTGFFIESLIVF